MGEKMGTEADANRTIQLYFYDADHKKGARKRFLRLKFLGHKTLVVFQNIWLFFGGRDIFRRKKKKLDNIFARVPALTVYECCKK